MSAAHELLLRDRKIFLLRADNPHPFKLLANILVFGTESAQIKSSFIGDPDHAKRTLPFMCSRPGAIYPPQKQPILHGTIKPSCMTSQPQSRHARMTQLTNPSTQIDATANTLATNMVSLVHLFAESLEWGDEAHFWLNGYVNKQNCRIWSEANPQVFVETPLHPEKLTVWCALWAGGILLQKR
ncbi:hypothetical protein TNCV_869791 [Trichonephila clavipes]|nr:hypothetical protein TNCV_869791 [Trichonephila clavipes]